MCVSEFDNVLAAVARVSFVDRPQWRVAVVAEIRLAAFLALNVGTAFEDGTGVDDVSVH